MSACICVLSHLYWVVAGVLLSIGLRFTSSGAAALLLTYGVYDHFKLDPVEQISKKAER